MAPRIETVLFDIDGVLTDGNIYVAEDGKDSKRFSYEDLDAFNKLKRAGIVVGFITGEKNAFTAFIREKFAPPIFAEGSKHKLSDFKALGLNPGTTLYVGDSEKDKDLLEHVRYGFVPKGASLKWHNILDVAGGAGVIAKVAEIVLEERFLVCDNIDMLHKTLNNLNSMEIVLAAQAIAHNLSKGGKLLICGNGGSAAEAQHMAAELVGRFLKERKPIEAIALTTDTSILTALGNDYDFTRIFARQVEAHGRPGDILLAISASGKSKNVLAAVTAANTALMLTVGLSGLTPISGVDYNIAAPNSSTPRVQEAHTFIVHQLCEYLEDKLGVEK